MENDCENANTHTLGGVGTFTKKKKLELMWINSVKKWMRKVIHIVFSTWEQGFETSSAECPPVECEQFDGATSALYRKYKVS